MAKKSERDDFTPATKRVMGERVAWRCCFPGCLKITIGPQKGDSEKSQKLGHAAHIKAASKDGPRYDPAMTSEERKHLSNGIWMCNDHGKLIDNDWKEYSATTLKFWKEHAEEIAYQNLRDQTDHLNNESFTYVALGFDVIFQGKWKSVVGMKWVFEAVSFLNGNINSIRRFADDFNAIPENQKYVIVETQGDARRMAGPVQIEFGSDGTYLISMHVLERVVSALPVSVGIDLELGVNGDLVFNNGGFSVVSGIDAAIQKISVTASTIFGEMKHYPEYGSHISAYYNKFHDNDVLLMRLIKIELIRLSLIPPIGPSGSLSEPPLGFIKEVVKVGCDSLTLVQDRLKVDLVLVLGDETRWEGSLRIFIKQY